MIKLLCVNWMLVGMSVQRVNLTFPKVVTDTGRSKAPPDSQREKKKELLAFTVFSQCLPSGKQVCV